MTDYYKASNIALEFGDTGSFSVSEIRYAPGLSDNGNSNTGFNIKYSVMGTRRMRPRGTVLQFSSDPEPYADTYDYSASDPDGLYNGLIREDGLIPGSTLTISASMDADMAFEKGFRSAADGWVWYDNQGHINEFPNWQDSYNRDNGWPGSAQTALTEMNTRTAVLTQSSVTGQQQELTVPIIPQKEYANTLFQTATQQKHQWFIVARAYDSDGDVSNLTFSGSNNLARDEDVYDADDSYLYFWINPYFEPYTTIAANPTRVIEGKPTLTYPTTTATENGSLEPGDTFTINISNIKERELLTGIALEYQWHIVDDPSGSFELPTTNTFGHTSFYKTINGVAPNFKPTSGDYWILKLRCSVTDGITTIYSDTVNLNIKRQPISLEYIKYNSFYSYIRNNNTSSPSAYNPNLSGKIQQGDLVIIASSWSTPDLSTFGGLNGQTYSSGRPRGIPNIISQNGFNNLLTDGVIHGSSYLSSSSGRGADYYTPCYAGYTSNAATGANQAVMMAAFWKIVDGNEGELDLFDDNFNLRNEETQVWIYRGGNDGKSIYGGETITADVAYYSRTFSSGNFPQTRNTNLRLYGNPDTQTFYKGKLWDPQVPDQTTSYGKNGSTLIFHFYVTTDPYFPSNHTSSSSTNDNYGFHTIDSISSSLTTRSTGNDVRSWGTAVYGAKWSDGRTTSGLNGIRFAVGIRQLSGDTTDQFDGVFYPDTDYNNNKWINYNGDVKYKQYDVGMYGTQSTNTWNTSDPHTGATAVLNLWTFDPLYP